MSVINNVLIRTSEYLNERGLLELFLSTDKEIPLYYQYNQTSKTVRSLPEKDKIGVVTNIREIEDMVICTVQLDDMKIKSQNFMGLIDNYTLKTIKDNLDQQNYEIVRFVIYDKDFKRKVDEMNGKSK